MGSVLMGSFGQVGLGRTHDYRELGLKVRPIPLSNPGTRWEKHREGTWFLRLSWDFSPSGLVFKDHRYTGPVRRN